MYIKIYILKRKKMYLTGIFNIPVASTRIVKIIVADISIITYFQCLKFNPKIFCRPKSNVVYKVSVCKWFFCWCSFSMLKLSGKRPKAFFFTGFPPRTTKFWNEHSRDLRQCFSKWGREVKSLPWVFK